MGNGDTARGFLRIRGAREHNLRNIDLDIPRDKLVVITGLSGSGKSSLAFDTIYAEGQRRYVESLSAYARQFLEQMEKPDVDLIEGLSPAISIEQKTTSRNPRSTVGTVTEIYDYLRLLYARVGMVTCYNCGKVIASQTVQQMVDRILALPEQTKVILLAPVVKDRKGEYRKELAQFQAKGFVRARVDGKMVGLDEDIKLDKNKKHSIDIVVDRLVVKDGIRQRLADSLELSLKMGEGVAIADTEQSGNKEEILFSELFACVTCGISYPEIAPRMFSFNNPHGACPGCDGLGVRLKISPDKVIPDPSISIRDGAIAPWSGKTVIYYFNLLEGLAEHYGFRLDTPFGKLPKKAKDAILFGSGKEEIRFYYETGDRKHYYKSTFEGVLANLERRYKETDSDWMREEIHKFMSEDACPQCNGARLRKESLAVKIDGKSIAESTMLSIRKASEFFRTLDLSEHQMKIARRILKEITERLGFLENVGLDYLTLDRSAGTLSGGEGQRIRLATQIGSSLVGVLYILDEPSIGLHQRDNKRLLDTLLRLKEIGNTVIVVEHDRDTILSSDYVVDLGPGAGVHGGEIVSRGTPEEIMADPNSVTGQYLSYAKTIPVPELRRPGDGRTIKINGATHNNLKGVDFTLPLGTFTCVTGVSGSGKSSLVIDVLYREMARRLWKADERPGKFEKIEGAEWIDKVIDIDQSPIGRTPRSNPATYTGLFGPIRELFAELPESKKRGYQPGRFSFNVKGGRCEACEGDGIIKIEMHFLPDIYVPCEICKGKRFNRETLEVEFKGKSVADVLDSTVEEALEFFSAVPPIRNRLETLNDVGLGYIKLGQSATTLSGGEAQRVKLAKELSKRGTGNTLYILDEPTTGLHFADIGKLLEVLLRLRDAGNTILVIEHNLDVIKTADYIVDIGPEGGDKGGEIVAAGTPEEVALSGKSHTGFYLKEELGLNAAISAGAAGRSGKLGKGKG